MFRFLFFTFILTSSFWLPAITQANSCTDVLGFPKLNQINARLADPDYLVLILGRHGKASATNKFTATERKNDPEKVILDIQRPLEKKGEKAAMRLGELFGRLTFGNVGMWGSHALRVLLTAEYTIQALGDKVKIHDFTPDLYYADIPKEMHKRLTSQESEDISHAFFWGHGKTTLALFKQLTGATEAFLPTSAVMIVALKADSWEQVFQGQAESIEGYAWSPNKSHKAEGQDMPMIALESMVEPSAPEPDDNDPQPDFVEININR